MPLHKVPDVEIFSTGFHDEKWWTRDDLKQIHGNFNKLSFGDNPYLEPTVVLGHEDRTDKPAEGVVKNLRYVESGQNEAKLFGDYHNVSDEMAQDLKDKKFIKTSAVVYQNFMDHQGVSHGLVLKEVAMLGATQPKQKQLAALPPPVLQYSDKQSTFRATFKFGDSAMDTKAMIATIKSLEPEMSDAFLAMLDDKQLAQLVKDLTAAPDPNNPNPTPAPGPTPAPAKMGDPAPAPGPTPPTPGVPTAITYKYAEIEGRQKALDARLSASETLANSRLRAEQEKTVTEFCDRMVTKGILIPAQIDHSDDPKTKQRVNPANTWDRLMRADAVNRTFKFSDGKPPVSELELQMAEIEAGPVLLKFGERMKDKDQVNANDAVAAEAKAYAERRNKILKRA